MYRNKKITTVINIVGHKIRNDLIDESVLLMLSEKGNIVADIHSEISEMVVAGDRLSTIESCAVADRIIVIYGGSTPNNDILKCLEGKRINSIKYLVDGKELMEFV